MGKSYFSPGHDYLCKLTESLGRLLFEMAKHFRYEYQREWRMVWNSEEPLALTAAPIFVEIGSLADSCEAYCL